MLRRHLGHAAAAEGSQDFALQLFALQGRITCQEDSCGVADLHGTDIDDRAFNVGTVRAELCPGLGVDALGPDEPVAIHHQFGRADAPQQAFAPPFVEAGHPKLVTD